MHQVRHDQVARGVRARAARPRRASLGLPGLRSRAPARAQGRWFSRGRTPWRPEVRTSSTKHAHGGPWTAGSGDAAGARRLLAVVSLARRRGAGSVSGVLTASSPAATTTLRRREGLELRGWDVAEAFV